MSPLRLHLLYEHGADGLPFGSASIRLLRPLTHPVFHGKLIVTTGPTYNGAPVDAVIVDRLWRPDISPALAQQLREQTSRAGACLLHALDDNLLLLAQESKDWQPTPDQLRALEFLLTESNGIIVTTEPLRDALGAHNSHIAVVPNMLDERLLVRRGTAPLRSWQQRVARLWSATRRAARRRSRPGVLIGYMGTYTHDDDLLMILPALQACAQRHGDAVGFELLGVAAHAQTRERLAALPVRTRPPPQVAYTRFIPWFSRLMDWDIALSPLCDTPFNACKSDIKFLDYSAIGAAGIFSRVPAYAGTVRHGETGWLVENNPVAWEAALETLIGDSDLREHLATQATRYLYAERIVAQAAGQWLAALKMWLG
jgi:glycosyltransferase involved in cell wall biosynthesis